MGVVYYGSCLCKGVVVMEAHRPVPAGLEDENDREEMSGVVLKGVFV